MKQFLSRIIFIFLLAAGFSLYSQTRVTGRVLDADTREPLPFVNIMLKNTKALTTSDFEGNYILQTNDPVDSIIVSFVGYARTAKSVKKNVNQTIDILLSSSTMNLQAVEIRPGENPAHRILRRTIENKEKNDRQKLGSYEYEVYNKLEFDLNNIPQKMKNRKLMKPFKFVFDNVDSSNIKEKPFLPVFMSESVSNYYYTKNPSNAKEVIKASKVAGIENQSVSQVMGDMYQKINLYENNMAFFGKLFASPISDNGLLYYRYYLIDSIMIGKNRCYHIQFKPRRKQELTFTGNMWIADTTFAIKRIEMSISEDANINWVNMLTISEEFERVDEAWMLSKERMVIEFTMRDKGMGVYGRKTTSYKDFVVNNPRDENFFSKSGAVTVMEGANKRDDDFWLTVRHDTLNKNEQSIYKMVDSVKKVPQFRNYVDIISFLTYGYKTFQFFPYVEWGNVFTFASTNSLEGLRLKAGGRTTSLFSKTFELNGYAAYGTSDKVWKYGGGFRWLVSKKPRDIISMQYKNDYELLGQSLSKFSGDNILIALFRRSPLNNFIGVEQYNFSIEHEWFYGLQNKITLQNRILTATPDFTYKVYSDEFKTYVDKEHIITSEVQINTRFAYKEKYVNTGDFSRINLGTKSPIINFTYTYSLKGPFQSEYEYHKINVSWVDRLRFPPIGYTDYFCEYGRIFNKVPYPLMILHPGNETYFYDKRAFNLMNFGEFISDEYISAAVTHHFDGFFLNHFPLFRKLMFREVVDIRGVFGQVRHDENTPEVLYPPNTNKLNWFNPYYEMSAGIENILKLFRVDLVYRMAYQKNPGISLFGIRGSLQVNF